MSEMRIVTVRNPMAEAIIWAGKDVENRSRNIAGTYRGLVAIHAAQRVNPLSEWYAFEREHPDAARVLQKSPGGIETFGAIIGVVDLVDVHTADDCWEHDKQRLMSLYQSGPEGRREVANLPDDGPGGIIGKTRFCSSWAIDGHHHLVLANPRPLSDPIPYRGALGLRRLPGDLVRQVLAGVQS